MGGGVLKRLKRFFVSGGERAFSNLTLVNVGDIFIFDVSVFAAVIFISSVSKP